MKTEKTISTGTLVLVAIIVVTMLVLKFNTTPNPVDERPTDEGVISASVISTESSTPLTQYVLRAEVDPEAEKAERKDALVLLAKAENHTSQEVYKFTVTAGGEVLFKVKEEVRVRPSPWAGDVSFGKIAAGSMFSLEYFYTIGNTPKSAQIPQDGKAVWIGIPIHLLDGPELGAFELLQSTPAHLVIWDDLDGVIWISGDYLDIPYLGNYPHEKVNLDDDIVTQVDSAH